MPLEEAVKYVASAYAIIIVVFIAYLVIAGRRIGRLQRDVQAIDDELTRREGRAGARRRPHRRRDPPLP